MLNKIWVQSVYLLTDSSAMTVHNSRKFFRCMAQKIIQNEFTVMMKSLDANFICRCKVIISRNQEEWWISPAQVGMLWLNMYCQGDKGFHLFLFTDACKFVQCFRWVLRIICKNRVHYRLVKNMYCFKNSAVDAWKLNDDICLASHSKFCFSVYLSFSHLIY